MNAIIPIAFEKVETIVQDGVREPIDGLYLQRVPFMTRRVTIPDCPEAVYEYFEAIHNEQSAVLSRRCESCVTTDEMIHKWSEIPLFAIGGHDACAVNPDHNPVLDEPTGEAEADHKHRV